MAGFPAVQCEALARRIILRIERCRERVEAAVRGAVASDDRPEQSVGLLGTQLSALKRQKAPPASG